MESFNQELLRTVYSRYQLEKADETGIELLRKIEHWADRAFMEAEEFKKVRECLGAGEEQIKKVEKAAVLNTWDGVEDFSEEFFKLLEAASVRNHLVKAFLRFTLQGESHGFDSFDTKLIRYSSEISDLYDTYYKEWLMAMRTSKAAERLVEMMENKKEALEQLVTGKQLDNQYTVITLDQAGEFTDVPYGEYFYDQLSPIIERFEVLITDLQQENELTDDNRAMIEYLQQYQACLMVKNKSQLEEEWTKLDYKWMDVKHPIQIVHDIESDYGDPLRVKVIPDFSVRFLDTTREKENKKIDQLKKEMLAYYKKRGTKYSELGEFALNNSMGGIYYLPFQAGMSLHFRFAGQSIPNRQNVKDDKGVKIYYDPKTLELRKKQVVEAIETIFADTSLAERINLDAWLTEHLPAHEFGHAVYNLRVLKPELRFETESLLEESRADLTGYLMLDVLHKEGRLGEEEMLDSMFTTSAFDLRRFVMWDSVPLKPYIYSAMNSYKKFAEVGYLYIKDDKLHLDESKAQVALDTLRAQFEGLLDLMDSKDLAGIDQMLEDIRTENDFTKWMVSKLHKK